MGRHTRRAQKKYAQAARRGPGRGQGRDIPRSATPAPASLPAGNAVPVQRREALPEQWPALPEESRPVRLGVPVQANSRGNDQGDRVAFSITDADGRQKTWSFSGVDRVGRALCRLILSCGLVVALIIVPAIAILAHNSMLDKVICGLGGVLMAGLVGIGAWARRWLEGRSRNRRDKTSAADAGRG
jgi:hypothetical protein